MSHSGQQPEREPWENAGAMTLPRTPRRGEKVRVDDQEGTFIVVRIDKIDSFANLELWDDPARVLWDVPFGAIRLVRPDVGETGPRAQGTELR